MAFGTKLAVLVILLGSLAFAGTTGKIAGIVTDGQTGEPLPGVNIIVQDMFMGAATDLDGYYVILNVPPGTYTLETSMVGYAPSTIRNVKVSIDQTSAINFKLMEETMELDVIEVIAERPIVERDVAASRANITTREIESIPVVSVSSVVGLQAGVEGFSFRGSGTDEVAFIVNGLTLRDERNNTPFTAVSLTSVEEVQIQSGGFSAEFGQVRSGLVNVVTKEGGRSKYSFSFLGRYKAAAPKHFGPSPSSANSYWIRPYLDDEVCWTGTENGAWDEHTQKQFPTFEGWNAVSQKLLNDNNPDNDYTPEMAQRIYMWEHRRDLEIRDPDYSMDFSFGGPVPFISKDLGNLRFQTSYIRSQNMYLMPLSEDAYRYYTWSMKLTSDISDNQKIMVEGFLGEEWGTGTSQSGYPGLFSSTWEIGSAMSNGPKYIEGRMFGTDYWAPSSVYYTSLGVKYTNTLSSKTYYEASLHRFSSKYDTNPGSRRNNDPVYSLGEGVYVSESPFGWEEQSTAGINGFRTGAGFSNSRDSSFIATYTGKFDLTSQVNRFANIKAGAEFTLADSRVNYARFDRYLPSGNTHTTWERTPVRGAMYIQNKLEFEGMIAQLGLRLDYFHAGGDWYTGFNPYDPAFSSKYSNDIDELLDKEPTKHIFTLSPRLGISFPITENSKLYFNYGHFRQLPSPENLFILRKSDFNNQIEWIANPNNPLPKTVSYELGYEHNLFDEFLLRTAGYYKDVTDQPRTVTYSSYDGSVDYSISEPNSYEDIRGFEVTLTKNRGSWVRGFINYTYMVSTYGYFGFSQYKENPVEQRQYERETQSHYQTKPIPRPYARANLDFFTPEEYGPAVAGFYPLEDLRLSVLANWKAGSYFTYVGGGAAPPEISYNMQWKDYYNINLRLEKSIRWNTARFVFFVDLENAFNFKRFSSYGFVDNKDQLAYYESLHLPKDTEGLDLFPYINIPGDDQPGEYRASGVDFVQMTGINNHMDYSNPQSGVIYYESSTGDYLQFENGQWQKADKKFVDKVIEDKAYIDMPNLTHFTFLDPRSIFWGVRLTIDL